jgi:purine-cytosine permease-like protein
MKCWVARASRKTLERHGAHRRIRPQRAALRRQRGKTWRAGTPGALPLAAFSLGGPRLGLPQMVQSRRAFGYFGNFAPAALNSFTALSYFAVNTILGVFALQVLLGLSFGPGLAILIIVQAAIAVAGHHLIHVVERWLSLLLIVTFITLSVWGFGYGHTAAGSTPGPQIRSADSRAPSSS